MSRSIIDMLLRLYCTGQEFASWTLSLRCYIVLSLCLFSDVILLNV